MAVAFETYSLTADSRHIVACRASPIWMQAFRLSCTQSAGVLEGRRFLLKTPQMKFAEFKEGMVIHGGPLTVTEAEVLAFARQYDPQWFHTDVERAEQGRWGGLIASGWHTCAMTMRMAV